MKSAQEIKTVIVMGWACVVYWFISREKVWLTGEDCLKATGITEDTTQFLAALYFIYVTASIGLPLVFGPFYVIMTAPPYILLNWLLWGKAMPWLPVGLVFIAFGSWLLLEGLSGAANPKKKENVGTDAPPSLFPMAPAHSPDLQSQRQSTEKEASSIFDVGTIINRPSTPKSRRKLPTSDFRGRPLSLRKTNKTAIGQVLNATNVEKEDGRPEQQ